MENQRARSEEITNEEATWLCDRERQRWPNLGPTAVLYVDYLLFDLLGLWIPVIISLNAKQAITNIPRMFPEL
jgi:hypothetical protein